MEITKTVENTYKYSCYNMVTKTVYLGGNGRGERGGCCGFGKPRTYMKVAKGLVHYKIPHSLLWTWPERLLRQSRLCAFGP